MIVSLFCSSVLPFFIFLKRQKGDQIRVASLGRHSQLFRSHTWSDSLDFDLFPVDLPVHLAGLVPAPILYIWAWVLAFALKERVTQINIKRVRKQEETSTKCWSDRQQVKTTKKPCPYTHCIMCCLPTLLSSLSSACIQIGLLSSATDRNIT